MAEKEKAKKQEVVETKGQKPAEEGTADAKKAKKIKRRHVPLAHVYIQASYNNTIVTIAEPNGNVIAWSSAGGSGFKGSRKSTPYAAQIAAENAAEKAKMFGVEKINVYVKGVGNGRDQCIRGLVSKGFNLISINDLTPIPHNGCRQKKARRV